MAFRPCEIDHRHTWRRLCEGFVLPVHVAKELERVFIEYGVCDAWVSVEVDKVEVFAQHAFHHLEPGFFSALLVRQAQIYHSIYTVWMQ